MTQDFIKLERGWALIAEGAQEISLAYAAMSQPAGGGVPLRAPAPVDLPPLTDDDAPDTSTFAFAHEVAEKVGGKVTPDTALGRCPVHGTAWTVKAGGMSKNGKPYKAFWKCSERDGDEFCNEKPISAWANSHPPDRALVSA